MTKTAQEPVPQTTAEKVRLWGTEAGRHGTPRDLRTVARAEREILAAIHPALGRLAQRVLDAPEFGSLLAVLLSFQLSKISVPACFNIASAVDLVEVYFPPLRSDGAMFLPFLKDWEQSSVFADILEHQGVHIIVGTTNKLYYLELEQGAVRSLTGAFLGAVLLRIQENILVMAVSAEGQLICLDECLRPCHFPTESELGTIRSVHRTRGTAVFINTRDSIWSLSLGGIGWVWRKLDDGVAEAATNEGGAVVLSKTGNCSIWREKSGELVIDAQVLSGVAAVLAVSPECTQIVVQRENREWVDLAVGVVAELNAYRAVLFASEGALCVADRHFAYLLCRDAPGTELTFARSFFGLTPVATASNTGTLYTAGTGSLEVLIPGAWPQPCTTGFSCGVIEVQGSLWVLQQVGNRLVLGSSSQQTVLHEKYVQAEIAGGCESYMLVLIHGAQNHELVVVDVLGNINSRHPLPAERLVSSGEENGEVFLVFQTFIFALSTRQMVSFSGEAVPCWTNGRRSYAVVVDGGLVLPDGRNFAVPKAIARGVSRAAVVDDRLLVGVGGGLVYVVDGRAVPVSADMVVGLFASQERFLVVFRSGTVRLLDGNGLARAQFDSGLGRISEARWCEVDGLLLLRAGNTLCVLSTDDLSLVFEYPSIDLLVVSDILALADGRSLVVGEANGSLYRFRCRPPAAF